MRLRQAMQREASAPQVQQLELSGLSGSSSSTVGSEHSAAAAQQQGALAGPVAALLQRDSSSSLSGAGQACWLRRLSLGMCGAAGLMNGMKQSRLASLRKRYRLAPCT